MSRCIGIFSQLANGKDTIANYLCERLNQRNVTGQWARSAFANAVKNLYQEAFGVDRVFVEKWKRLDEPPSGMKMNVRRALQFIGDGFRQIKDDVWIDIALRGAEQKIFSDGRYFNEAKAIKNEGGLTILLWRPSYENDDPNPSESQIRPVVDKYVASGVEGLLEDGLFNFFIRNNGTVGDLYRKVEDILIPYIERWHGEQ